MRSIGIKIRIDNEALIGIRLSRLLPCLSISQRSDLIIVRHFPPSLYAFHDHFLMSWILHPVSSNLIHRITLIILNVFSVRHLGQLVVIVPFRAEDSI